MSANSNNQSHMNNNEGQVVAVEMLRTSLAIGGLQEQIESGDQSKETADT